MATKLYNTHLSNIFSNCNEYYILDTYISLVHISSEVNTKYLIQTFSDSKADLIYLVRKHVKASYKTIYNCIDKLISIDILTYDNTLHSWSLVNMENMTKSKNDAVDSSESSTFTGYTHIRSFFFTDEFSNMKAREKRLLLYMAQLSDSKASDFHKDFSMNLLKPNSPWLSILKTKSKYYAKYTIIKMLSKYSELFIDKSEELRSKDLAPRKNKNFKFLFNCSTIKNKVSENEDCDLVKINNPEEYALVLDKVRFAQITLSKQQIMHLVRAITNVKEWFLKERISQLIINKFIAIQIHQSRENIKSLPAYAAAVVKSVVTEFKEFKAFRELNNIKTYDLGEHFIDYANDANENNIASKIQSLLPLF